VWPLIDYFELNLYAQLDVPHSQQEVLRREQERRHLQYHFIIADRRKVSCKILRNTPAGLFPGTFRRVHRIIGHQEPDVQWLMLQFASCDKLSSWYRRQSWGSIGEEKPGTSRSAKV
jgi:hypothetical protein